MARAGMFVVLGLVACGDSGDSSQGDGEDGTGETTMGSSDTDDAGMGASTGREDDPLDGTGGEESGDPPEDTDDGDLAGGCQRIDFLFVIDNSVSMKDEQEALTAAVPGFMDAIVDTLEAGRDHHVMVVDTDRWGRCDTANGWEGHTPGHDSCNAYIEDTIFEQCDRVRGAGVIHPAGKRASNERCEPQGGNRYIVEGEPNFAETFACMAKVGTAGHPSERPMNAITAALAPQINGPDGCNEGFLRDDALLVVTFISDDSHYEDKHEPADWYQAVVDAKHGEPGAVVMLGMTPAWEGCGAEGGSTQGEHWAEFLSMWGDNGLHGNVCGSPDDYVAFFDQAIGTIDQACGQYVPPESKAGPSLASNPS